MKFGKIAAAASMAAAFAVFSGPSAHAAVDLDNTLAFDTNITSGGSAGSHKVTSMCSAIAGTTTGFDQITYQVRASADATGPSVALSTGVRCVVYNKLKAGEIFGIVTGALIGSHAEAIDDVTVTYDHPIKIGVCVRGSGQWLDGTNVPYERCVV